MTHAIASVVPAAARTDGDRLMWALGYQPDPSTGAPNDNDGNALRARGWTVTEEGGVLMHAVDTLDGSTDYQPVEQALLERMP